MHFVREPTWIVPSRLQTLAQSGGSILEVEINEDEGFSKAQIERFKSDPVFYRKFIKAIEEVVNGNFPLVSLILHYCVGHTFAYLSIDPKGHGFRCIHAGESEGIHD